MTIAIESTELSKPKGLDKLERVLQGIWSGELKHDQSSYFCGSACCVAGWLAVIYGTAKAPEFIPPKSRRSVWYGETRPDAITSDEICAWRAIRFPFRYAKELVGLTCTEANLMFSGKSTKTLQNLVLQALKSGRRIDGVEIIISPCFATDGAGESTQYQGSVSLKVMTNNARRIIHPELLARFLGLNNPDVWPLLELFIEGVEDAEDEE